MKGFWYRSLMMLAPAVILGAAAHAQLAEFNAINAAARDARQRGDQAALQTNLAKLATFIPGHPFVQVARARSMALNGDRPGAISQLRRLADLGLSFDAAGDAAFQGIKDDPGFAAAARRLVENGKGLGRDTAIIKLGLTSGSEGVAWSEQSRSFLMGSGGSIHAYKLGQEAATPVARAFASQILGIRPDPASASYLVCVNEPGGDKSAVVRHHELSGAISAIHALPTPNALCNDIALLKNGSFAVTDSNNGMVLRLVDGKLEPLPLTLPIYQPNGIASDLDRGRLYIAHAGGVVAHDLATGRSSDLAAAGALIGGLDGMVWHEGVLIGVQNLANASLDSRLLRITPDPDATSAKVDVLLAGADFRGSPSTVAVVGDEAFVIARTPGANGRVEPILIRIGLSARD